MACFKNNKLKVISADQRLRIKNRGLNKNNLFSKFTDLIDDDDCNEVQMDDNLIRLTRKLKFKNKITQIRNKPSELKNVSTSLRMPERRNKLNELNLVTGSSILYDPYNIQNEKSNIFRNKKMNSKSEQKKGKSTTPKKIRELRSNNDLYAETISRQLKEPDIDFMKFVIQKITPNLAFKLSNKVLNDENVSRMETTEDEEDYIDSIDKFLQLIQKEKDIPNKIKQSILDYRFTSNSFKLSKIKKKKIKKTVESLNFGFDNLVLDTESINDHDKFKKKKEIKNIFLKSESVS